MAIRRAFVIGAPIALVAIAIAAASAKRLHDDGCCDVRHVRVARAPRAPRTAREVPAPPAPEGVIVSLTRIGDDEIDSDGFTLKKPLEVRVYAVGEGIGNEMYDYGWILNASTREPVWQMRYRDTEPAGGASKNRMVNEVISLDPGSYIVHYLADGSHSWNDWNASPPKYENAWGITLVAADGKLDDGIISEYDVSADPNIIAQLVAIRDDDDRGQRFTLQDETEVRIYALGEGDDGEMYDYAWIEDAETGKGLWEMTYRITEHAGGARKNRMYDGIITLPAGEYVLRYEADDSHSLEEWNSAPPDDPFSYGVTLFRVNN